MICIEYYQSIENAAYDTLLKSSFFFFFISSSMTFFSSEATENHVYTFPDHSSRGLVFQNPLSRHLCPGGAGSPNQPV